MMPSTCTCMSMLADCLIIETDLEFGRTCTVKSGVSTHL